QDPALFAGELTLVAFDDFFHKPSNFFPSPIGRGVRGEGLSATTRKKEGASSLSPHPTLSQRERVIRNPQLQLSVLNGFEEGFQLPRTRGMAQLAQGFGFDLTNAFAGHGKVLTDFLERVFGTRRAQAKPHLDHFFFAWR